MEFVRLKYANNKLFNANLKEHTEVIEEYVTRRGCTYLGFVPVVFGPNGKMMEIDLIFQDPKGDKVGSVPNSTGGAGDPARPSVVAVDATKPPKIA